MATMSDNGIAGLVSVAWLSIRDAEAFIDTTSSMQKSTENTLVALGLLLDIVTRQQEDIQRLTRLLDEQQHPHQIKINHVEEGGAMSAGGLLTSFEGEHHSG